VTWWLGREDSNLRMAESKSDRFHCKINAHSEKLREFAPKCINSLAPISEWGPSRRDRTRLALWAQVHCAATMPGSLADTGLERSDLVAHVVRDRKAQQQRQLGLRELSI
jgi:hypothetical protein